CMEDAETACNWPEAFSCARTQAIESSFVPPRFADQPARRASFAMGPGMLLEGATANAKTLEVVPMSWPRKRSVAVTDPDAFAFTTRKIGTLSAGIVFAIDG